MPARAPLYGRNRGQIALKALHDVLSERTALSARTALRAGLDTRHRAEELTREDTWYCKRGAQASPASMNWGR
jgi:hypothetical protein